tara:strand:- start:142 stop:285 length:144 start_codon:yes stop_codon:yes gene_type:complete
MSNIIFDSEITSLATIIKLKKSISYLKKKNKELEKRLYFIEQLLKDK